MATVNTASLRSEFDALKARFEALCADGAMSAESRALFEALLMRLHDPWPTGRPPPSKSPSTAPPPQ